MGFIFSSLGAGEILLVLAVALLLFGAEKFPSMARALGKALSEIRRAADELSSAIIDKDMFLSSAEAPPGKPQGFLAKKGKDSSEQREQRETGEGKREG